MNLMDISDDINAALSRTGKSIESDFKWVFKSSELRDATFHLLSVSGKLLRPGLVFVGSEAIGSNPMEYVELATAIEYLHISSLIHDDIVDKDEIRRGKQAVHVKYGIENAILAGDALIARAVSLSSKYGEQVVSRIAGTAFQMCDGEGLDFSVQNGKIGQDYEGYMEIARRKTASLISTSLSIAAVREGREAVTIRKLETAGENLGVAFQIRDDIINSIGAADLGKRPGNDDLLRNRPNVVTVLMADLEDKKKAVSRSIDLMEDFVQSAILTLSDFNRITILKKYINTFFDSKILRNYIY
ncbi:MAG: polyprenyl synthetase family protein [Candidatus Thermoplasmatota archaeon]|jgi:geranylgeranyl pyrophosphate synthase|nr:polyprenyl synthetase family protein [Candidatus Thermoplasmatota archaeon]